MAARVLRTLLLAAALACAAAEEGSCQVQQEKGAVPNHVVELTDDSFAAAVKAQKWALVDFSAPTCSHCKAFDPEYTLAAAALHDLRPDVLVAKVDAEAHPGVKAQYNVERYPTLKLFVDGVAHNYTGGRTGEDIVFWVRRKAIEAVSELRTVAEADEFRKTSGAYFLLGFFESATGKEAAAFHGAAKIFEDTFGVTTSADVASHLGMPESASAPAVAIVKSFDEPVVVYDGKAFTPEALAAFAETYSRPLLVPFRGDHIPVIMESRFHVVAVVHPEQHAAQWPALRDAMMAAATSVRGMGVQFVAAEMTVPDADAVLVAFGVSAAAKLPAPLLFGFVGGAAGAPPAKFRLPAHGDGALSAEALAAFARSVADGSAPRLIISAEAPSGDNDNDVTIVVGNTLEALVLSPDVDALLCVLPAGGDAALDAAVTMRLLGRRFAAVPTVRVALMDGSENEHPAAFAPSLPTMLFYPAAHNGTAVRYDGPRTLTALTTFVQQHAALPFQLPADDGLEAEETEALAARAKEKTLDTAELGALVAAEMERFLGAQAPAPHDEL